MLLEILAALTALTAVDDSYPSLSPDGHQLLFSSNRSGKRAIWMAKPDGSGPRLLFDGGNLGDRPATAVWSPDGKSILFAMTPKGSTDPNESEIYLMDASGRNIRRLTHAPGDDSHPHWSADGRRIFFNSARATPDLKAEWSKQWIDIYSMAADGGDIRRYTDCKEICTYPVPSPDGRFVAHRRVTATPGLTWELDPGQRNSEVFVTALDGSSAVNVSNSVAYDGWPMWAPDGHWLVFSSNRDKLANIGQIYAVRPDGTGLRALTSGTISRVQPSFSADGKQVFVFENVEAAEFEIGHIARIDVNLESGR
jgi:Tol biopolymer transport system component